MKRRTGLALLAVIVTGIALAWWNGRLLPRWVDWNEKETDLSPYRTEGVLILKDRRLKLVNGNDLLFVTPVGWYVSDYKLSDFDLDGKQEVLFLLWRHGEYGASHPFWEIPDRLKLCQHLYIFKLEKGELNRQWMSSELNPKICEWDIDEEQNLSIISDQGESSVWRWYGYSVRRVD